MDAVAQAVWYASNTKPNTQLTHAYSQRSAGQVSVGAAVGITIIVSVIVGALAFLLALKRTRTKSGRAKAKKTALQLEKIDKLASIEGASSQSL